MQHEPFPFVCLREVELLRNTAFTRGQPVSIALALQNEQQLPLVSLKGLRILLDVLVVDSQRILMFPPIRERLGFPLPRSNVIRVQGDGQIKRIEGFSKSPQLAQNFAFLRVSACVRIVELKRPLTRLQRLRIAFQADQNLSPLFMQRGAIDKDLERLVVESKRLLMIPPGKMEGANIIVDVQIEWIEFYTP